MEVAAGNRYFLLLGFPLSMSTRGFLCQCLPLHIKCCWAFVETMRRPHYCSSVARVLFALCRLLGPQDDAHIFCQPSQIRSEIRAVLDLTETILTDFGFKQLEVNLSTRPDKYVGSDDIWETATQVHHQWAVPEARKSVIVWQGSSCAVDSGVGR